MYRKMSQLDLAERKQILMDYQVLGSAATRDKHNISNNTLQHIHWYHGDSLARRRKLNGEKIYHNYLLEGVETLKDRVASLKEEGMNSIQIAEKLDLSLEAVNKVW